MTVAQFPFVNAFVKALQCANEEQTQRILDVLEDVESVCLTEPVLAESMKQLSLESRKHLIAVAVRNIKIHEAKRSVV